VTVGVDGDENAVRLSVTDTGMGIAAEDIPKLFNPFYRGDRSRNRPGNGLGLALAGAIARAHRGAITVTSSPGQGSTFAVRLPYGPTL